MAYWINDLTPGNQFPKAECMLYAKSRAIRVPVDEGYKDKLSVV